MDKYKHYSYEPLLNSSDPVSIENHSMLYRHQQNSHIILIKSQPVQNLPIFKHYFISYKNWEIHPGAPDYPIAIAVDVSETRPETKIEKIMEYCEDCGNEFLKEKIMLDKNFSILFNNCDSILNNSMETFLFFLALLFVFISIHQRTSVFLVFTCISILTILISNKIEYEPIYVKCKHIKM